MDLVDVVRAPVDTIRDSVTIGVQLIETTATEKRIGLQGVVGTIIQAIEDTITVGVRVKQAAATSARVDLVLVERTAIEAVEGAVSIEVGIQNTAPTEAGVDLVRIGRAAVEAVKNTITIAVDFQHSAAAQPRFTLEGVVHAAIDAVGDSITVGVDVLADALVASIGNAVEVFVDGIIETGTGVVTIQNTIEIRIAFREIAATDAGFDLLGIQWTQIVAVERAITVGISIGKTAPAEAGRDLGRIIDAAIDTIRGSIAISVDLGNATPALTRVDLGGIIGTIVTGIDDAVEIAVDVTGVIEAVAITISGLTLDDQLDAPACEHTGVVFGLIGNLQRPLAGAVSTGEDGRHQLLGHETEVVSKILSDIAERTTWTEITLTIVPEAEDAVEMPGRAAVIRDERRTLLGVFIEMKELDLEFFSPGLLDVVDVEPDLDDFTDGRRNVDHAEEGPEAVGDLSAVTAHPDDAFITTNRLALIRDAIVVLIFTEFEFDVECVVDVVAIAVDVEWQSASEFVDVGECDRTIEVEVRHGAGIIGRDVGTKAFQSKREVGGIEIVVSIHVEFTSAERTQEIDNLNAFFQEEVIEIATRPVRLATMDVNHLDDAIEERR